MHVAARNDPVTVAQLAEFDEIIDVRSPVGIRRGPHSRRDQLPGARRRRARAHRHAVQAGLAVRCEEIGRGAGRRNIARHIEDHVHAAPARLAAAGLLLARRPAQRRAWRTSCGQIGWRAGRLDGGYKAYRREVLARPRRHCRSVSVARGLRATGSGKSRLLRALACAGRAGARPRSAGRAPRLGARRSAGRAAAVAEDVRQPGVGASCTRSTARQPVFVEAESKKIGRLRVPEALIAAMWASECVRARSDRMAIADQNADAGIHRILSPIRRCSRANSIAWSSCTGRKQIDAWKALAGALLVMRWCANCSKRITIRPTRARR